MSCILKPMKEVEEYALPQKKEYYTSLKNICNHFKGVSISCNRIIELAAPVLRKFKIDIRGIENHCLWQIIQIHMIILLPKRFFQR